MCLSDEEKGLFVMCDQEKWDKAKVIIEEWYELVVDKEVKELSYKNLEKGGWFLSSSFK